MTVPLMLINWATVAIKQGLPLYFSRDMRPWQINCTTVCISEIYMPWPSSSLLLAGLLQVLMRTIIIICLISAQQTARRKFCLFDRWDKHEAGAKQEVLGLAWSVVNLKFGNVMWCQHKQSVSQQKLLSF